MKDDTDSSDDDIVEIENDEDEKENEVPQERILNDEEWFEQISKEEMDFYKTHQTPARKLEKAKMVCTACMDNLKLEEVKRHPILGVPVCEACRKYFSSGKWTKGDDDTYEQCRWCGNGGNLLLCEECPNAFCKKCIKSNMGRKEVTAIEEKDWYCLICDPKQIYTQRTVFYSIYQYFKTADQRKEMQKRKRKQVKMADFVENAIADGFKCNDMMKDTLKTIKTKWDRGKAKETRDTEDEVKKVVKNVRKIFRLTIHNLQLLEHEIVKDALNYASINEEDIEPDNEVPSPANTTSNTAEATQGSKITEAAVVEPSKARSEEEECPADEAEDAAAHKAATTYDHIDKDSVVQLEGPPVTAEISPPEEHSDHDNDERREITVKKEVVETDGVSESGGPSEETRQGNESDSNKQSADTSKVTEIKKELSTPEDSDAIDVNDFLAVSFKVENTPKQERSNASSSAKSTPAGNGSFPKRSPLKKTSQESPRKPVAKTGGEGKRESPKKNEVLTIDSSDDDEISNCDTKSTGKVDDKKIKTDERGSTKHSDKRSNGSTPNSKKSTGKRKRTNHTYSDSDDSTSVKNTSDAKDSDSRAKDESLPNNAKILSDDEKSAKEKENSSKNAVEESDKEMEVDKAKSDSNSDDNEDSAVSDKEEKPGEGSNDQDLSDNASNDSPKKGEKSSADKNVDRSDKEDQLKNARMALFAISSGSDTDESADAKSNKSPEKGSSKGAHEHGAASKKGKDKSPSTSENEEEKNKSSRDTSKDDDNTNLDKGDKSSGSDIEKAKKEALASSADDESDTEEKKDSVENSKPSKSGVESSENEIERAKREVLEDEESDANDDKSIEKDTDKRVDDVEKSSENEKSGGESENESEKGKELQEKSKANKKVKEEMKSPKQKKGGDNESKTAQGTHSDDEALAAKKEALAMTSSSDAPVVINSISPEEPAQKKKLKKKKDLDRIRRLSEAKAAVLSSSDDESTKPLSAVKNGGKRKRESTTSVESCEGSESFQTAKKDCKVEIPRFSSKLKSVLKRDGKINVKRLAEVTTTQSAVDKEIARLDRLRDSALGLDPLELVLLVINKNHPITPDLIFTRHTVYSLHVLCV